MSRGDCGDLLKVSVTCLYSLQTNTSVAAEGCGYVESHETLAEVPFTSCL